MLIKAAVNSMCEKMVRLRWVSCWTFMCTLCFSQRIVVADLDKTCTLDHRVRGNQGICGEKLSEILHFLCGARYNKRSIPDDVMPLDVPDVPSHGPSTSLTENSDIFLSKDKALSYLRRDEKRSTRHQDVHGNGSGYRGIVCECCHHRCSIKELTQYCADPNTSLGARLGIIGKRSVRSQSSSRNSGSLTRALLDLNRLWEQNEQERYTDQTGDINANIDFVETGPQSNDETDTSKESYLFDFEKLRLF